MIEYLSPALRKALRPVDRIMHLHKPCESLDVFAWEYVDDLGIKVCIFQLVRSAKHIPAVSPVKVGCFGFGVMNVFRPRVSDGTGTEQPPAAFVH